MSGKAFLIFSLINFFDLKKGPIISNIFPLMLDDSLGPIILNMKKLKIVDVEVIDIRVPTSDTLQGSDPFHKKPNWSCVYTSIKLDNGIEGLSVCFTSGAGNDWIAYGVRDIAKLFKDFEFIKFIVSSHAPLSPLISTL